MCPELLYWTHWRMLDPLNYQNANTCWNHILRNFVKCWTVKSLATESIWLITKIGLDQTKSMFGSIFFFTSPSLVSLPSSWSLRKDLKSMNQHFWISRINAVNDVKCQYFVIQAQSDENIMNPLFYISGTGCTERMMIFNAFAVYRSYAVQCTRGICLC